MACLFAFRNSYIYLASPKQAYPNFASHFDAWNFFLDSQAFNACSYS